MPCVCWDLLGRGNLCTSWPRIGLFQAASGLSRQSGGGRGCHRDQLCLSGARGDSAPARFSAKRRDEVARPGSVCCRLEGAQLWSLVQAWPGLVTVPAHPMGGAVT